MMSICMSTLSDLPLTLTPQNFSDVFPHLVTATNVPKLVKIEDVSRTQHR